MAKSGKGGRPRKYNKTQIDKIKKNFKAYINDNFIPIIAEFAYENDILRETLYDYAEFATLLKKAIQKKEANLEKGSLTNKINTTMAIFSLKQLGWSDKMEMQQTTKTITEMSIDEIDKEIKEYIGKYVSNNRSKAKKNTGVRKTKNS